MCVFAAGYKGYVDTIAVPILQPLGREVLGIDNDFFEGCNFGEELGGK